MIWFVSTYDLLDIEMNINARLKYRKGIKKIICKIRLKVVQYLLKKRGM